MLSASVFEDLLEVRSLILKLEASERVREEEKGKMGISTGNEMKEPE